MIFVELLEQLSIEQQVVVSSTLVSDSSWLDPCFFFFFFLDRSLPTDAKETEKVRRTLAHFWISEDKMLSRHSFGGPYLLCLHLSKATKLLAELYEGICGGNSGGRTLSPRAIT